MSYRALPILRPYESTISWFGSVHHWFPFIVMGFLITKCLCYLLGIAPLTIEQSSNTLFLPQAIKYTYSKEPCNCAFSVSQKPYHLLFRRRALHPEQSPCYTILTAYPDCEALPFVSPRLPEVLNMHRRHPNRVINIFGQFPVRESFRKEVGINAHNLILPQTVGQPFWRTEEAPLEATPWSMGRIQGGPGAMAQTRWKTLKAIVLGRYILGFIC